MHTKKFDAMTYNIKMANTISKPFSILTSFQKLHMNEAIAHELSINISKMFDSVMFFLLLNSSRMNYNSVTWMILSIKEYKKA